MTPLIRCVGAAGCGVVDVSVIGAPRPKIELRAPADSSKPVALMGYSRISNAIRGVRHFEREVMG
jgi:hypothetical protein